MGRGALTLAVAVLLLITTIPNRAAVGESTDVFGAMGVHRPVEPFAAPDLAFISLDGREVRLGDLRGKVVLLGFFTTT